ncbi:MAG: enoyl-CoA hydratase-related protein [Candidatus Marinimicrobia bacterium]|jgi:enoyl-CoA hydratase|nr:enoyl-CoA hydratase-related protein [Candidatus Neomarinimicrobiota bacterium]MDP6611935.1 enoyl-CoA hydratase-related protein [Candidatus Neomarinimicrobiota bacterium]|tara:strand:- start:45077 stop:45850 length:774 start_codon:yes stop_codon:yes gene_type:complete
MSFVLKEISGYIAVLTINRPDVLNAMNDKVVADLESAVQTCIDDKNVGVIILTGSGDKAFVAGADIKKMQGMGQEGALTFGQAGQDMTLTIENSPKPVIAAVNGFALGGGCEISMACHLRVASETATFGQPEVLLGILPGWGGTQRLPRLVGTGMANEIITTGRMVKATEAKNIGLVNHVVPAGELMEKCISIAKQILKNGPEAIAQSLDCIRKGIGTSIIDGMAIEVKNFSELFGTEEAKEGLTAFVEKRKPSFRD